VSTPKVVTVVVPVFNGEAFLRESLDSIVSQTYEPLEVIVMDDASTDASAAIAAEYEKHDPRVRLVRQPSNIGQFANVNAGIQLTGGDLVAVYHADDVYDPDIVAREAAYLEMHADAGAVFALATFIDQEGREFGRLDQLPPEIEGAELLDYPLVLNAVLRHTSSFLPTPSALVRRTVYAEVGPYSVDDGIRGDLDMWLRIARRHPVGLIRDHLMRYRVGTHNESRRYGYLRTELDRSFTVIDRALAAEDPDLASAEALTAYEARRAADLIVTAGNAYVVGSRAQVRSILRSIEPSRLVASGHVQRWRLLALLGLLHALARLPHSATIARFLRQRWHTAPVAE
jgi:glycosyltransferase involved in cell wall biosynthesis